MDAVPDNDWLALRAEIEQQVDLVDSPIVLGGVELNWLRVANPDVLLERALAADDSKSEAEIDPFWAATWRAALGLDSYLARIPLHGVRVLELGCGSGQAGTAAAIRGARVTATDSVQLALQVAELNSWFVRDRIEFESLVWQRQTLDADPFSIILGSDLVYDPNLFASLEHCARKHLAEGGRMFLSEPHRHTGDEFSQWIRTADWNSIEHDVDLKDDRVPVRIFECWLQS